MRKAQLLIPVLLLVLVACAPKAAPAPQALAPVPAAASAPAVPAPAVPASAVPAKPAWEVKWDETVSAGKKESIFVLYTGVVGGPYQAIFPLFTKKYGVAIERVGGTSGSLSAKLFAEQRAGLYMVDLWISGATSWTVLEDKIDPLDAMLILPDLTEPELIKKTWFRGRFPWTGDAHRMVAAQMDLKRDIVTNTNLVKAGELKTYRDLLDPKWKGKISIRDPRGSGGGNMWFSYALESGDVDINYMRELATKQEIFVTRDTRLQVEWLAHGKHAIAIGTESSSTEEFIKLGLPIKGVNLGTPTVARGDTGLAMVTKAPRPNAAKLLINWFLSQEGQTIVARALGSQSKRLDVPTDHLDPSIVLSPETKFFDTTGTPGFDQKKNTYYRELAANEVFGK